MSGSLFILLLTLACELILLAMVAKHGPDYEVWPG